MSTVIDPVSSAASPAAATTAQPARNGGLDALRSAMTLLVILHHAAITYGGSGGWFYKEFPTDGSVPSLLLTIFCAVNQAYFMGLFFLLAGYYTPASIRSKGVADYLKERALRLGIPLLLFGFVVGPMTVALERASSAADFMDDWGRLLVERSFINGPLWFTQALLIFAVLSVIAYLVSRRGSEHSKSDTSPALPPFPSNTALLLAALATGTAALILRQVWPVGTNVWGLQLGYFASYVVLFAAGYVSAKGKWLERIPAKQRRTWLRVACFTFPLLPLASLLVKFIPQIAGPVEGGWNGMAVIYAFWEPFLAWGVVLALLALFQERFAVLSDLGRRLSARAYGMFIVHPPILVGVALAWASVPAPSLLKFIATSCLTCWLCYLLVGLLLTLPGAKRIL